MISSASSTIVQSILKAIHILLSHSMISTRCKWVVFSGSMFLGSHEISVFITMIFHVPPFMISLNCHVFSDFVTSIHNSSLISLASACCSVSPFSIFHPGK
jgi:hypothetical protein